MKTNPLGLVIFPLKQFFRHVCAQPLRGFSLLELAIALVVIGVMAAGVMKGRELLSHARFHAVASQVRDYRAAVFSFRDVYGSWPGDFDQASFSFDARGCNDGNGNGIIDGRDADYFWLHLAQAGYIAYPGVPEQGQKPRFGSGFPESRLGGGFIVAYNPSPDLKGHWLILSGNEDGKRALLTPKEARILSKKLEDGNPMTGDIQARDGIGGGKCLTTHGQFTASTESSCVMYFKLDG